MKGGDSRVLHPKRIASIIFGALLAATGLQFFLVPNHLIDGGVVGLSLIGAQLAGIPFGAFLILLNIPFIYLGYRKLGPVFALYSASGIVLLALLTGVVHFDLPATNNILLAAAFGGCLVGVGIGLVIRYGGTLDGADIIAILVDRQTTFSIGETVMFINIFILSASGFVFGWDNAMFSLIAYFIAHKALDATVEGFNESRSVWIVSRKYRELGHALSLSTRRRVTYINGRSDEDIVADGVLFTVIKRPEERRLKRAIQAVDPAAFVVISEAHEIIGKHFE